MSHRAYQRRPSIAYDLNVTYRLHETVFLNPHRPRLGRLLIAYRQEDLGLQIIVYCQKYFKLILIYLPS